VLDEDVREDLAIGIDRLPAIREMIPVFVRLESARGLPRRNPMDIDPDQRSAEFAIRSGARHFDPLCIRLAESDQDVCIEGLNPRWREEVVDGSARWTIGYVRSMSARALRLQVQE